MLTITLPSLPDAITFPVPTCLCVSLPEEDSVDLLTALLTAFIGSHSYTSVGSISTQVHKHRPPLLRNSRSIRRPISQELTTSSISREPHQARWLNRQSAVLAYGRSGSSCVWNNREIPSQLHTIHIIARGTHSLIPGTVAKSVEYGSRMQEIMGSSQNRRLIKLILVASQLGAWYYQDRTRTGWLNIRIM